MVPKQHWLFVSHSYECLFNLSSKIPIKKRCKRTSCIIHFSSTFFAFSNFFLPPLRYNLISCWSLRLLWFIVSHVDMKSSIFPFCWKHRLYFQCYFQFFSTFFFWEQFLHFLILSFSYFSLSFCFVAISLKCMGFLKFLPAGHVAI